MPIVVGVQTWAGSMGNLEALQPVFDTRGRLMAKCPACPKFILLETDNDIRDRTWEMVGACHDTVHGVRFGYELLDRFLEMPHFGNVAVEILAAEFLRPWVRESDLSARYHRYKWRGVGAEEFAGRLGVRVTTAPWQWKGNADKIPARILRRRDMELE